MLLSCCRYSVDERIRLAAHWKLPSEAEIGSAGRCGKLTSCTLQSGFGVSRVRVSFDREHYLSGSNCSAIACTGPGRDRQSVLIFYDVQGYRLLTTLQTTWHSAVASPFPNDAISPHQVACLHTSGSLLVYPQAERDRERQHSK